MNLRTLTYSDLTADVLRALTSLPRLPYADVVDDPGSARLLVLRLLMDELQDQIATEVRAQRRNGTPWGQIALSLGVTRQAVQQRFGKTHR